MNWELLLPAFAGGFGVFFLIQQANKAPDTQSCYFGIMPIALLALGPVMCSIAIYSLYFLNEPGDDLNDDTWLKPAYIIGLFVFTGFFFDSLKRKITWSDSGLTITRLLRAQKTMTWNNVQKITYNNWAQWWKIHVSDGTSIIFYDMMRGSGHFIEECKNRGIEI